MRLPFFFVKLRHSFSAPVDNLLPFDNRVVVRNNKACMKKRKGVGQEELSWAVGRYVKEEKENKRTRV